MLGHTDRERTFRAVRGHRARHQAVPRAAREGGGRCYNPYIDGFTKLTVLEDRPDQLVVHARYFHRDRFREGGENEGGQICTGFAERTFTLARSPEGDLIVVGMTGEQDEPVLRSLLRRALPG